VRELDRQIATKAYHRLRKKRGRSAISRSANDPNPDQHIRDPFVLEFLNLKDRVCETLFLPENMSWLFPISSG
jgi:predicted nuclease of restriction endonuclease-like (RecB) superfamily